MGQTARKKVEQNRPRRRKPRLREPVVEEAPKGSETGAFLLGTIGVFLALAITSHLRAVYTSSDLSPEALTKLNLIGIVGYISAATLFKAFGWCSYAVVLWLLLLSRSVWKGVYQSSTVSFLKSSFSSLVMAIAAAIIASIFWDTEGGGFIGLKLSSVLLPYFNTGGTILLAGLILMLSFVSSTGVQLGEVFGVASTCTKQLSHGAVVGLSATTKVSAKAVKLQADLAKKVVCKTAEAMKRKNNTHLAYPVNAWDFENLNEPEFVLGEEPRAKVVHLLPAPKVVETETKKSVTNERKHRGPTLKERLRRKKKQKKTAQNFNLPPIDLLSPEVEHSPPKDDELLKNCKQLEQALADFKVGGKIIEVQPGPVITLYEFEPAPGVKVQRVIALADDLALALKVASVRVYAPVPGKGTVGIEVPNLKREIVALREILDSEQFSREETPLTLALGKDTFGVPYVCDLGKMPHLLIAGATGTGKSVCINSILMSLLYRNSPELLRLIMIDPKMLELSVYDRIPHLKSPVVTNPKRARGVLWWAVEEMERRYRLMMELGVRNLDGYNRRIDEDGPEAFTSQGEHVGEVIAKLPYIVIVVDELADLMLTVGREIEELLTRLAQKARAAGIHLIVATQRPSVNVITGLIKANFPSRISFKVASRIDSRTVLDGSGSERLLGQGDMLFVSGGAGRPKRLHGAFVSDNEVHQVVSWWRGQGAPDYDSQIEEMVKKVNDADHEGGFAADAEFESDPLYDQALQLVVEKGQASTSMIQRVFRIGYNRAARILEMMEREGVVGAADGAKPRQILAPRHPQ